jgi:Cobalamin biosynthesis protein CbiG
LVFQIAPDFSVKNIAVGVGCERGTAPEELIALVRKTLQENDISSERVAVVVSLDLKADEPAVHAVAKKFRMYRSFF